MANTVIGLFENAGDAQKAVQRLVEKGLSRDDIDLTTAGHATGADASDDRGDSHEGFGDKVENFFSSLFGDDEQAGRHAEVMRRGSTLLTVHGVSGDRAEMIAEILDDCGAIDVDERSTQYRGGNNQTQNQTRNQAQAREATIPVVEEQLEVGKRQVERGGVRVRSRIVERPVQEELRLREEHVNVERRPADRLATEADLNRVREGTFDVTERAEQPVVNKETRVVEEVAIGKEVEERTETVRDTLRKTEVDVQKVTGDKKSQVKGSGR